MQGNDSDYAVCTGCGDVTYRPHDPYVKEPVNVCSRSYVTEENGIAECGKALRKLQRHEVVAYLSAFLTNPERSDLRIAP